MSETKEHARLVEEALSVRPEHLCFICGSNTAWDHFAYFHTVYRETFKILHLCGKCAREIQTHIEAKRPV